MWLKWLPWKYVVSRLARTHGFLDPVAILTHLRRFAQPSEVAEPVELLRAGMVFHARGLMNSRAIQHNLDWVWPYWVARQFDPNDESFVPRAFSLTHLNLTHRNWTGIGRPDSSVTPIVDPRGLTTPFFDGWSVDGWIIGDDGRVLLPSTASSSTQRLILDDTMAVETLAEENGLALCSRASVVHGRRGPLCVVEYDARIDAPGWAVIALRPCNAEGVSFMHSISLNEERDAWRVDEDRHVRLAEAAEHYDVSTFHEGDVYLKLVNGGFRRNGNRSAECDVGMATAVACYRLEPGVSRKLRATIPVARDEKKFESHSQRLKPTGWDAALESACRMRSPDIKWNYLFDAAIRSMILHSPGEVYPGPYTYKRFWFRDAAFILYALQCAGLTNRVRRALNEFKPRQQPITGYFVSQEGEWDSNGEALWALWKHIELSGRDVKSLPVKPHDVILAADWIVKKRQDESGAYPGLFPAGFSAEHLGMNDFYFWDDFWSVAGLRAAANLLDRWGDHDRDARRYESEAERFLASIDHYLEEAAKRLGRSAMPAAPGRRMDAGAVGSLVGGYPLNLLESDDPRLIDTNEFLEEACLVRGGFFQDMIHSGINPYLTLHMAQTWLRAGDSRWLDRVQAVADLASETGQWPEAVHPRTLGGCMGDGHHVWASAEWAMMMRSIFVREEGDDRLILASGIPGRWLDAGEEMEFGPTMTSHGPVRIRIKSESDGTQVDLDAAWRGDPPECEVRLPGHEPCPLTPGEPQAPLHRSDPK